MPSNDLPAAIEAAELHVHAADGHVEFAAARLRQGWTRRRRPATNLAKVALPLLAVIWLARKKRSAAPRGNGMYYVGPVPPMKTNFLMGLLATAVATRALWVPVLSVAIAEMQRRRAAAAGANDAGRGAARGNERGNERSTERSTERHERPGAAPVSSPNRGYPGTEGTAAAVGSDPRVEAAGYH